MRFLFALIVLAAIGAFVFIGCNKVDGQQAQQTANNTWEKTKQVAGQVGEGIKKTTDQMSETAKVKGPISASSDIDSSEIDVTTVGKTVYLNGSVPNQAMKDKAEQMARTNMDSGYTLESHLKVAAKAPPQGETPSGQPRISDDQPVKK